MLQNYKRLIPRLKIILLLLLLFPGVELWYGCKPSYIPANHFLIGEDVEKFGYGLYSYILFTKPGNKDTNSADLLTVFLNKREELEEISQFKVDSTINIIYLPLKTEPPANFKELTNQQKVKWLMENYNYNRASNILDKLNVNSSEGFFIVSSGEPLFVMQKPIKEGYLLQNLTHVPASVGALWMNEFIQQSYQTESWDQKNLELISLNLRKAVGNATKNDHHLNKSVLQLEENLDKWIAIF